MILSEYEAVRRAKALLDTVPLAMRESPALALRTVEQAATELDGLIDQFQTQVRDEAYRPVPEATTWGIL